MNADRSLELLENALSSDSIFDEKKLLSFQGLPPHLFARVLDRGMNER